MKKTPFCLFILFVSVFVLNSSASDFEIKFKSGNYTPEITVDLAKAITPVVSELSQDRVYRLIQFYAIPTEQEKKSISDAGIELLSYIPNKAFICGVDLNISAEVLATLNIRSLVPMHENFKVSEKFLNKDYPYYALSGDLVKLNIKYYSKEDKLKLINDLNSYNASILGNQNQIKVISIQINSNKIETLKKNPLVQWIDFVSAPKIKDDLRGESMTRSNGLNTAYSAGRKYDGTGVVVGLGDDGLVGPHIDFEGRLTDLTVNNNGSHGDMTTGILCGAGNLNPTIRGMASGADIYVYNVGGPGFLGYPHIDDAISNMNTIGTVITSTSYSQGTGGNYNADAEYVDEQLFQNQSLMHVFSAGNAGSSNHGYGAGAGWGNITGGSKAGKNVICSGNLSHLDVLVSSSSRGPADDGRIKPDLCAYGNGQLSTDGQNTFQVGGGTSAAAPTIAGVFTQLYQAYKDNNGGVEPETGLIKASLMNTAEDLENPGPDFKTGWGRINGLKAVRILEENRYIKDSIGQGQTDNHNIIVPANVSQLRVMTYWTDMEGNPGAAVALVNDINMQVTDPSSVVHNPLVLDPTPNVASLNAVAVPGVDSLNNVEQVRIDNPAAGTYTVDLIGYAIPFGPQKYYIVYDFIYEAVELTYPLGGEGFVPGVAEMIRWDAPVDATAFELEYSIDGGSSYTSINNSISGTTRTFAWNVPNQISNTVKLRIKQGSHSSESDTVLTIVPVPQNLNVSSVCPDSIVLNWNSVAGVSMYEVSVLGNKYMDSVGTSTTNSFAVTGLNPLEAHWFSVRSIVSGDKGRRAIAIYQSPGTVNCQLNDDVGVTEVISPAPGIVSECREYSSYEVTVKVINFGASSVSNVNLFYQLNSGTIISEVVAGPIAPGSFINYTFTTTADLSSGGIFNVSTWVVNSPDQNYYNDTLNTVSDVMSGNIFALPFTENFNSFNNCSVATDCEQTNCSLSNGWVNLENLNTDDIDWRTDSGGTASQDTGPSTDFDLGTSAGKYLYLESSSSCNNKEALLLTPCFDLSNIVSGNFNFAYHMYGSNMGDLHLDIITTNSVIQDVISPITGDQGNSWLTTSVDLAPYAGDTIKFRFRGITGNGFRSDIAIDAISVYGSGLGVNEGTLNATSVVYYPVPSAGLIDLNITGLDTDNLEMVVTDIDGRIILSETHSVSGSKFTHQFDLSHAAKGVYFVRLKSNQGSRIDRVVLR